jgi:hypothetical protein
VKSYFSDKIVDYTGEQLRSGWAGRTFGIEGDCIVAFIGECDVKPEFMVDLRDLEAGEKIYSPLMLHFIIEHSEVDLEKGVLRQRLLAAIAADYLRDASGRSISRDGDDLYFEQRKISISIATVSPVSTLIHFGINIQTEGVPVPACGLEELGLQPDVTAHRIMEAYIQELTSIEIARTSVKIVT